ncbi:MAG: DUF4469 domain-containing protein [Tannerellaceae bacterium]|jgi:hypothetical protein|nr:DUF4469 domain-containing protein [Tannerellaceae bacterium]
MHNFFLTLRDTIHAVTVKFVRASLPSAGKAFTARVVHQTELDLEQIAEKAAVYNLDISPDRIVDGARAFITLCCYLCADGYKLKTPLFNSYLRIPGEYDGHETHLPPDIRPSIRMEPAADFRDYVSDRVKVTFDGIDNTNGFIADLQDELSGSTNLYISSNALISIHGSGLKIASDDKHAGDVGLYLIDGDSQELQIAQVAVNEPKMLKAYTPAIPPGTYTVVIRTQTSGRGSGSVLLKDVRELSSDFTVEAIPS